MKYSLSLKYRLSLFIVCIVLLASCGNSATEQLQNAVAPTSTSEAEEETTEIEVEEAMQDPTNIPEEPTTVSPTSTPEPTELPPTPTPEPEPITLQDFGFGQNGRSVGYSFIVQNPNSGLAFESSQYQIAAFDESGAIVETDSGFITLILPDQTLGIGGTMFLDEGVEVNSIEVQLNAGDSQAFDPIPNFTTDVVVYHADDFSSRVNGLIQSPYNRTFSDIRISAVLYNEANEIVGGGFTFLNFILANSTTGVSISVEGAEDVIRAELYPTLSNLSLLASESEIPPFATNLNLLNQGYGQDGISTGYGLVLENPNSDYSVENSQYHITFFADDNTVVTVEEGYINLILPEQVLGIGGEVFLGDSMIASRMEVQVQSGDFVESTEQLPAFSSENVTFSQGTFSSQVTGFIVNPYTKDVTNLRVYAIALGEDGTIIGGGSTFLDFASANGKSAVEVSVTTDGTPVTVELHATTSNLTKFD